MRERAYSADFDKTVALSGSKTVPIVTLLEVGSCVLIDVLKIIKNRQTRNTRQIISTVWTKNSTNA